MIIWALEENGKPLREMEVPTPDPVGEQVLLEVIHCGVCHSDIHIWEGHYDLGDGKRMLLADRGVKLPLALGHEIVGRVVKLGPEAKGVAVGDTRIVFPWVGCGHCYRCLAEEDNLCAEQRPIGVFKHGGFATHVLAIAARHLVDPGSLDLAVAATYACSGITVYSAIQKLMPMPAEQPIVIVGAGGLGLAAIAVLKALKHHNIVVVDVSVAKRDAAKAAGATLTIDGSGPDLASRIIQSCGGPVLGIIDMVNATMTARAAIDALAKGGRVTQVGLFGGDITLSLPLMPFREITVGGSAVGSPKQLAELVALAQEGSLRPLPVEKVPLQSANEALMRLRSGAVVGRLVLTAS